MTFDHTSMFFTVEARQVLKVINFEISILQNFEKQEGTDSVLNYKSEGEKRNSRMQRSNMLSCLDIASKQTVGRDPHF